MLDRRRFLKLVAGGFVAAAHGGIPTALLAPAAKAVAPVFGADADGDFAASLIGLLVNSRRSSLDLYGLNWTQATVYRPVWPDRKRIE